MIKLKALILAALFLWSPVQAQVFQAEGIQTDVDSYVVDNDSDIVRAVVKKKALRFVEGGGMQVVRLLPDDNSGRRHQKWIVKLSNGTEMLAVYNVDMCPQVPVKVGDVVSMGGELVQTKQGPLLHWLHHDPKNKRPDGYVYLAGKFYCID